MNFRNSIKGDAMVRHGARGELNIAREEAEGGVEGEGRNHRGEDEDEDSHRETVGESAAKKETINVVKVALQHQFEVR